MVITISIALEAPAGTILELLRNLPEVPVLRHPSKRWSTIASIDFEAVKCGPCTKSDTSKSLPEANPLGDSLVLINNFTLLETKRGIGVH